MGSAFEFIESYFEVDHTSSKMSWQSYVDTQLISKDLKGAAIAGLDGNIWAKSEGFNITVDEIKTVLNNFGEPSKLASTGINVCGTKYFYLSGNDEVLRGKQGKGGIHIMKTKQTLLIGIYNEPMLNLQLNSFQEISFLLSLGAFEDSLNAFIHGISGYFTHFEAVLCGVPLRGNTN